MWDDFQHWYWLAWAGLLLLFIFVIYWAMIKSANHFRYRLYPPEQTVPILNESSSTATEKKKTNTESRSGEENKFREEFDPVST